MKKDIGGLLGFSAAKTAETWLNPGTKDKIYWVEQHLRHKASSLLSARHHFLSALLVVGGTAEMEGNVSESELRDSIASWCSYKGISMAKPVAIECFTLDGGVLFLVKGASK